MTKSSAHFVVTGCARSGTGYTARLLTDLGVPCDHEALFTPYTERFDGFSGTRGDSSWLAVPFIDQLPAGTVVLHQVRHPKAVVSSLLGIRFFADDRTPVARDWRSRWQVARAHGLREIAARFATAEGRSRARRRRSDFVAFVRRHCPEVFAEADEAARAARYWVAWNLAAARAADRPDLVYLRYRVEDLDAGQTMDLLSAVGAPCARASIDAALARLPRHANTRPSVGFPRRSASPLVDLADAEDVAILAETYGYCIERG